MRKRIYAVVICLIMTMLMVSSAKAAESVTIYVDDGNADYLVEVQTEGEKTAEGLIKKLVEYKLLPKGTKVNSYETVKKHGKMVGNIDLSKEYLEAVSHTGTAGETIYIYSVVNTLIRNLDIDSVYMTSDGGEIATGHAIYDSALGYYDHVIAAEEGKNSEVTVEPEKGGDSKKSNTNPESEQTDEVKKQSEKEQPEPQANNDVSKMEEKKDDSTLVQESKDSVKKSEDQSDNKMIDSDENNSIETMQKSIKPEKQGFWENNWKGCILVGAFALLLFSTFLYVKKAKKA